MVNKLLGSENIFYDKMVRYTFFRWTGGKEWLWKLLKPYLISDDHDTYIEPFLGGGAIAIHYLKWCRKHNVSKKFILSDTNRGLINAYIQIRDNVDGLMAYLDMLDNAEDKREVYYERRKLYNSIDKDSVRSAGLFIWLMANGWRGLYRVNRNGEYNSPFGTAKEHSYTPGTLRLLSILFRDVTFICASYEEIDSDGLIYLDPPYINTYNSYSLNAPNNQELLAYIAKHQPRSTIFVSNNQHFLAPKQSIIVVETSVYEKSKTIVTNKRAEYVWMVSGDISESINN